MITLESDRARVELDPDFGARVCGIRDKRTGRDWLVPGPREGDAGDGAAYRGAEARGWDECFPTVAPCEHPAWGRLRDHGLLWGRPWEVEASGAAARATCRGERFAFTRRLELDGATLAVAYELEGEGGLPWMWSQHALLAARPGERIVLEGFAGFQAGGEPLDWPHRGGRDLSAVGEAGDGFALKAYANAHGAVRAGVEGPEGGIAFSWHSDQIAALGLWLDWGGWPEESPVHQLAIEPTTAPADDLVGAERVGALCRLRPGEPSTWRVAITLTEPA